MTSQKASLPELFDSVKASFPVSFRPGTWYIVTASALVTSSDPSQLGQLYTYLTHEPEFQSTNQRRTLNRRLRELIMKQWVTVGAPKSAVALFGLIEAEQPGDVDLSCTRSHVALDAANRERGTDFLRQVYGDERAANMFEKWGGDFEWLTKDIVYGLFHADDSVFDTLETELITYTAIVCQGLRLHVPMANFLGGLKRLNLSLKEAEGVTACAEMVAKWAGQDTSSWPRVGDLIADWE